MTTLTERYTKALDYARVLFEGDVRKGTEIPYLAHLLAVSTIVLEHGGDEDQAIAALLHDAGEDKGGRARVEAIRVEFGDRVARIVEACSDSLEPQGVPKGPYVERKTTYIDRMRTEDPDAALVSAADKLHNAAAIRADYSVHGDELWRRFNGTREQTLWYYARLAEVLPGRLDPRAERLGKLLRATVGPRSASTSAAGPSHYDLHDPAGDSGFQEFGPMLGGRRLRHGSLPERQRPCELQHLRRRAAAPEPRRRPGEPTT